MTPYKSHTQTKDAKAVACGAADLTAGGTGDATAVTGAAIDRTGFGCAKFVVTAFSPSITTAKALKIAAEYQASSDGTNWDTAVSLQPSTNLLGAGTNQLGQVEFNVDLGGVKQYIRFNYTPDLTASGTDTAITTGTAVLMGPDQSPHA